MKTTMSHRNEMSSLALGAVGALLAMITVASALEPSHEPLTSAQQNTLARHFGFGPLEIFKLDHGITQLRTTDINADGLTDMVIANNKKSTIEVLLQRATPPDEADEPKDINDLLSHWRFERKKVSVTWEIACLKAADVTGDGHVDIVFFGDPGELVLLPGAGDGTFGDAITRRVPDGLTLPSGIDVADINADGRLDVVVLTESDVLVFYQPETGGLGQGQRYAHALENPLAIETVDINGDGLADIVLMTDDKEYPLQIRLQDAMGDLGPVHRIKLPALASGEFASCLGRTRADMFGVERVSGRLKRWTIDLASEADRDQKMSVVYYPFPGESETERFPFDLGDVNGDGRLDVVTANVDAAQLVLFLQRGERGLARAQSFGGQVKTTDLRCFDADGDGSDEVYVLSPDEESIARSVFKDNRLTYPKAIPTIGVPAALDVGRLRKGSPPQLVYASENDDGEFQTIIQPLSALSTEDKNIRHLDLNDVDDAPNAVRIVDVNRDGLNDVLVFSTYSPLVTLLQREDGSFDEMSGNSSQTGLVKEAKIQGFAYVDSDGDGVRDVLLAQKSFVRALHVNQKGAWEIIDQYNAPTSDAELTGLCAIPNGQKRPTLAMYDRRGKEVYLYVPAESGKYERDRSVQVGPFQVKSMRAAAVAVDGSLSVLLADSKRFALIQPDKPGPRARERGVYESSIKDARLRSIAVGDLNADGVTDVAVVDTFDHFVEILTFGPDESLVRGNKFRVFAKKQFRRRENEVSEPSWITIEDVTGDARDDLLLLARDRVLLYPAE
jgi:VCBS repeat protein